MSGEDIIKISCVLISAIGLLAVTQIYKPQIIDKTCEIINSTITNSNIEYSQVDQVYNYFTILPILTTTLTLIIGIIYTSGSAIMDPEMINNIVVANARIDIDNELVALSNLHVVTNFLSNKEQVVQLSTILFLKNLAMSFPVPVSAFDLPTFLNMEQFNSTIKYMYYEMVGGEYGAATAAFIKAQLYPSLFNNELINYYANNQGENAFGKLVSLYLYSFLSITKYNPGLIKDYIGVDSITLVDHYTRVFGQLRVTDIIGNPKQSEALLDLLGYLSHGTKYPGYIPQNIEIGSGQLGLKYLAWGDLLCQKFLLKELTNVTDFYRLSGTVYNDNFIPYSLINLMKDQDANCYIFCKNVVKAVMNSRF